MNPATKALELDHDHETKVVVEGSLEKLENEVGKSILTSKTFDEESSRSSFSQVTTDDLDQEKKRAI